MRHAEADPVIAPETGRILWQVGGGEEAEKFLEPYIGKAYKDGDTFCILETTNGRLVEIPANMGGRLVEIDARQGDTVNRGDVIAYINRFTATS